jgi:hypothetical protein
MLDPFSSIAQKKGFVATLFKMTASDNRLEAKELIYILEAGMQIGFDRETIIQIGQETELHPLVVPADEAQRMTMLYYLLFLMRIDGHIDPDEEIFAKMFGFKLGFNELMLEELVIVMKDHVNAELPEDLLIEKVRKYLN